MSAVITLSNLFFDTTIVIIACLQMSVTDIF